MTDTGQEKKFPVTEDIKEAMALIKRGTDTLSLKKSSNKSWLVRKPPANL